MDGIKWLFSSDQSITLFASSHQLIYSKITAITIIKSYDVILFADYTRVTQRNILFIENFVGFVIIFV
jgi:hypothetical protein